MSTQGGLVNLPPKVIPEGKIWSRRENGGQGGLIDKPKITKESRRKATTLEDLNSTLKSERTLRRQKRLAKKKAEAEFDEDYFL